MIKLTDTLKDAATKLNELNVNCLSVKDPGSLIRGILAREHIIAAVSKGMSINTTVEEVMDTSMLIVQNEEEVRSFLGIGQPYVVMQKGDKYKVFSLVDYAIQAFQQMGELPPFYKDGTSTLNSLNEELESIIESSLDGIFITDGKGYTLRINKAYEEITGIKREEILGKNMKDLVKEGYFSQSATLLVLKRRKPVTIMQQIKGGVNILVTGNPVFDKSGNITRVVSNIRDITELVKLKINLEEAKKQKDNYLLELTHLRSKHVKVEGLVASSQVMEQTLDLGLQIASVDATVLILGESGVGKEVMAKFIHNQSKRKEGPFIKINCGAIPEHLLESELFGYADGAFTGAKKGGKPGLFELAHEGTIFLDEIGDLPLDLQVKLLRVLEEQEFMRVGGIDSIRVDVRVISATNRDLKMLVDEGKFREDLYYRLNVVPLTIPPLRERKEDIPLLVQHYIAKINEKYKMQKHISLNALEQLAEYDWPGNVRELVNIIERLLVTVKSDEIGVEHLPTHIGNIPVKKPNLHLDDDISLKEAVEQVERLLINRTMEKYRSTRKAAKILGVSQSTIVRKINQVSKK